MSRTGMPQKKPFLHWILSSEFLSKCSKIFGDKSLLWNPDQLIESFKSLISFRGHAKEGLEVLRANRNEELSHILPKLVVKDS